ncbi:MAG: aminotransferase class IV [Actinomycetota bacterium]|nr:aminotransferase class IV [Actinomycetota bacterium]
MATEAASRLRGRSDAVPSPTYDWVFVDSDFVSADDARISVKANAVSYGTGTFDGMRATWNADAGELYLLEPLSHYKRLHLSAKALGLALVRSAEDLVAISIELLRRNDVRADAYVRPLLFLAGDALTVRMHDIEPRLVVYATPFPAGYIPVVGVRCLVSSWRRIPDACLPLRAKIIGSYANPALAKTEAIAAGCDEAIMLTVDGDVAEATTSNIFLRRGEEWITPSVADDILEGVTRRQVIELIRDELNEPVVERTIDRSELYVCDEALLCGTAVQVVPLIEVDRRPVGDGGAGERTRVLMGTLAAAARGVDARYRHWTTPVYGTTR